MIVVERSDGVFIEVDPQGVELREFEPVVIAAVDAVTGEIHALTYLPFSAAYHLQSQPCYEPADGLIEVDLSLTLGRRFSGGAGLSMGRPEFAGKSLNEVVDGWRYDLQTSQLVVKN